VLELSQQVVEAFEAEAAVQEIRDFAAWWNGRQRVLGTKLSLAQAHALFGAASEAGKEIGLVDNAENRLFLQAAALRLMPQPSAEQWLLIADAIFAPEDDDQRLKDLAVLARPAR